MTLLLIAGDDVCCYDVEPVGEVGITYEQMRTLIDSLLQQSTT